MASFNLVLHRLLTRFGYGALGVVYVALGAAALLVAIAGARDRATGFAGAFRFLLEHRYGAAIVTSIAAGLAAFVFARLLDAADGRRSTLMRLVAFVDALGHASLAWAAVALALGVRRGRSPSRPVLAWLLSQSWGAAALEVAAVIALVIGIFQLWQGLSGIPRSQLAPRKLGSAAPFAIRVGRFGLAVRGVVTAIIGWFLIRTAREADVHKFHEIGGALEVLRTMRFGGLLLGIAGAGLCAYGAYLVLLGFFRRSK